MYISWSTCASCFILIAPLSLFCSSSTWFIQRWLESIRLVSIVDTVTIFAEVIVPLPYSHSLHSLCPGAPLSQHFHFHLILSRARTENGTESELRRNSRDYVAVLPSPDFARKTLWNSFQAVQLWKCFRHRSPAEIWLNCGNINAIHALYILDICQRSGRSWSVAIGSLVDYLSHCTFAWFFLVEGLKMVQRVSYLLIHHFLHVQLVSTVSIVSTDS